LSKKKIKFEISDDENKVSITFEGKVTQKRLQELVASANNLLGKKEIEQIEEQSDIPIEDALDKPLYQRVKLVISTVYKMGTWFTTNEICDSYKDLFKADLKMTTASTYLARLYNEGYLNRRGSRNERKYNLKKELREKMPRLICQ
jgi:hypothetical protein